MPPYMRSMVVLRPVVIYPERVFGVSLIVAGSIFVALLLATQTALSHFDRHRSQTLRKPLSIGCAIQIVLSGQLLLQEFPFLPFFSSNPVLCWFQNRRCRATWSVCHLKYDSSRNVMPSAFLGHRTLCIGWTAPTYHTSLKLPRVSTHAPHQHRNWFFSKLSHSQDHLLCKSWRWLTTLDKEKRVGIVRKTSPLYSI